MHKLKVTLKQHTPLIHFQHDQEGATLRASEVKPRLDRFILETLGKIECIYNKALKIVQKKDSDIKNITHYEAGLRCLGDDNLKWLKENTNSIDYKLKISEANHFQTYLLAPFLKKSKKDELVKEKINFISPAPCFGDEDHYGIVVEDSIELTFYSYNSEILNCIENNISHFFVYNNFGFRQSKGFGCFSVEKINNKPVDKSNTVAEILNRSNKCVFQKTAKNDMAAKLAIIANDYQLLKSGKNHNGYQKSKLFDYMINRNLRWEKRRIKLFLRDNHSTIFNDLKYDTERPPNNRIACGEEQKDERYIYARALLGLAEHIEFTTWKNRGYNKDKIKMMISDKTKSVERFKSPLLFKVYDNYIYIIVDEINEKMFDRKFSFTLSYEKDKKEVNTDLFSLNTPTSNQFDLIEFLDNKLTCLGWEKL